MEQRETAKGGFRKLMHHEVSGASPSFSIAQPVLTEELEPFALLAGVPFCWVSTTEQGDKGAMRAKRRFPFFWLSPCSASTEGSKGEQGAVYQPPNGSLCG